MRLQRYVSNELTHFVGRGEPDDEARYNLLVTIIRGGWLTHPPHDHTMPVSEHFDADKLISADGLALRCIVCFCDIPSHNFYIHMNKYSKFALSFTKSFLSLKGASPVYYVATNSLIPQPVTVHKTARFTEKLLKLAENNQPVNREIYFDSMAISAVNIMAALFNLVNDIMSVRLPTQWSMQDLEDNMKTSVKTLFEIDDPEYAIFSQMFRNKPELTIALKAFCHFYFFHLLGFVKGFDSNLREDDPNNYYMEREWRVLGNVPFVQSDIQRVIFPRAYAERFRRDIPDYMGQIQFADADQPHL